MKEPHILLLPVCLCLCAPFALRPQTLPTPPSSSVFGPLSRQNRGGGRNLTVIPPLALPQKGEKERDLGGGTKWGTLRKEKGKKGRGRSLFFFFARDPGPSWANSRAFSSSSSSSE